MPADTEFKVKIIQLWEKVAEYHHSLAIYFGHQTMCSWGGWHFSEFIHAKIQANYRTAEESSYRALHEQHIRTSPQIGIQITKPELKFPVFLNCSLSEPIISYSQCLVAPTIGSVPAALSGVPIGFGGSSSHRFTSASAVQTLDPAVERTALATEQKASPLKGGDCLMSFPPLSAVGRECDGVGLGTVAILPEFDRENSLSSSERESLEDIFAGSQAHFQPRRMRY